jgi:hypothetical protein
MVTSLHIVCCSLLLLLPLPPVPALLPLPPPQNKQFEETDRELTMMVKPRFVPPGFPRYQEYYDKTQQEEKTWALRRDLKTGRSYGRIYAAADGTIIFRCDMVVLVV